MTYRVLVAYATKYGSTQIELFGGVINPAKLHFPFNHMPTGDARDWKAIRAFAERLATAFRPATIKAIRS
jgi:menaquinone-dependent protoporphyrinogen IX oxidase